MTLSISTRTIAIWQMFDMTARGYFKDGVRHEVGGLIEKFSLNELRVVRDDMAFHRGTAWFCLLEDRIKELEAEKENQLVSRKAGKKQKRKCNQSDGMSEIDKSAWRLPAETFIFRKARKPGDSETCLGPKPSKVGDYKFYIVWNDSGKKELDYRKQSQMDSLLNLFIASVTNEFIIRPKEVNKILETDQPPNRAVRDLNKSLVDKLRKMFPQERIPDLIIGYSKKEDGYITLVPILDESTLNTLSREDYTPEEPTKEFIRGARTMKRGGK